MSTTPAKLSHYIKIAVRFGSHQGKVSKSTAARKPDRAQCRAVANLAKDSD
jgi:hypothetical protein